MRTGIFRLTIGLAFVTAQAAFDVASLSTQTVKQGQAWANFDTKVDALDIDISVDHGVVTTTATLAYTPGNGFNGNYVCRPVECIQAPCPDICGYEGNGAGIPGDSLETTAWGNLGDNTAITEMYLWVGDTKVRAELQARGLASAQYEEIVKRRKDPALLETWGSGYYTLRIFPNRSGVQRKVQLRFVQGMEDESKSFATALPLLHTLQNVYIRSSTSTSASEMKSIGSLTLKAASVDGKTYSLNWPGLGEGKFSSTPLVLGKSKVEELKEGFVSGEAAACTGCANAWTAERGGKAWFGVKTLLEAKNLAFEEQPKERCVIVDVDASDSLAPARARKLALLSLKAYAQSPFTANLAFSNGKGELRFLFPEAAVMDAAHLAKALEALKAWVPVAKADAHTTLEAFALGRGPGAAPMAAILINNDPYEYYHYPVTYDPSTWAVEDAKAREFENLRAARADMLAATLQSGHVILFGFWNDYHLSLAAQATGGYSMGGIYGWIYPPYGYRGVVIYDPLAPDKAPTQWYLPPLFGPGRPDAYGVQDLKLTVSGAQTSDLVLLQENAYWRYAYMLDKRGAGPAAKSASLPASWYGGSPDSIAVRISGSFQGIGKVTFRLTGLWGGLHFAKEFTALLISAGSGPNGASLWSYQQVEAWGRQSTGLDVTAAQKLGMEYHVVNSQVSMLALEPGVKLWDSLPAKAGQNQANIPAGDSKNLGVNAGGMNLDGASLDDLLGAEITGVIVAHTGFPASGRLTVTSGAGGTEFAWLLPQATSPARFRILDVTGREVAGLDASRTGDRFAAAWKAPRRGAWILRAECGGRVLTRRFASGL